MVGTPVQFSSVQSLSHVWLFVIPWTAQHSRPPCPSPSPIVCPSSCSLNQWCHPTILSSAALFSCCLQSFPASGSSSESTVRIRWPNYWSFSFSISSSNEYSGLISFRTDWLDLAVQQTLDLLHQHSSKTSILWHSAFFMVQLSHAYLTNRKIKALIIRKFVGKLMSLLFDKLSTFFIAFHPRSEYLLISWLQSTFAVISEPKK